MVCYVYDAATLRPITEFDDQHFGKYFQYNSEGKLVRKLRETERGMKTVAETQYHTPRLITYAGDVVSMSHFGRSTPSSSLEPFGGGGGVGLPDGRSGIGTTFDMLDLEISPDGVSTKVFGIENPEIPDLDSVSLLDILLPEIRMWDSGTAAMQSLTAPALPELSSIEKLQLMTELHGIDSMLVSEQRVLSSATDDAARRESAERIEQLQLQRREFIARRLGLSEDEMKALYRDLKVDESDMEDTDE